MKRSPARRKYHKSSTIYTRTRKYSSNRRHKKLKKQVAVAIATACLLLFSVCFIAIMSFYKQLNDNFVSADSANAKDFDSQSLVSILYAKVNDFKADPVLTTSIKVLMLNKEKRVLYIYDVPATYQINTGKFKSEELSKAVALSRLDGQTETLLRASINRLFAYPIDKFFIAQENMSTQADAILENANTFSLIALAHTKDFTTNLSLGELIGFVNSASTVNKDNKKLKMLPDDYNQGSNLIETDLKELNFDSLVSQEKKSVSILNGTNVEGVAALGSKVVTNLGGRVISAANTQTLYDESVIVADSATSETVKGLVTFFNIKKIVLKTNADYIKENEIDRSDVTLILGNDIVPSL